MIWGIVVGDLIFRRQGSHQGLVGCLPGLAESQSGAVCLRQVLSVLRLAFKTGSKALFLLIVKLLRIYYRKELNVDSKKKRVNTSGLISQKYGC